VLSVAVGQLSGLPLLGTQVALYQLGLRKKNFKSVLLGLTVKKGHAKTFSSELIQILLLKTPKVRNILRNS
jgi:hypothetical protein